MRAVVYSSPGEVAVTDVSDPGLLADTDALVRISLTGIAVPICTRSPAR